MLHYILDKVVEIVKRTVGDTNYEGIERPHVTECSFKCVNGNEYVIKIEIYQLYRPEDDIKGDA